MLSSNGLAGILAGFVLSLLCVPRSAADEAIRLDGRHIPGTLVVGDSGRLQFVAEGSPANDSLTEIQDIRFPNASSPVPLLAPFCVQLANGQILTCELVALDEQTLTA